MIRRWASMFSRSVNKRVVSRRRALSVPVKISFEPDKSTGGLVIPAPDLSIRGETKDLSSSGIGFVVSSIRLQQYYLVGEGRKLNAVITLPKAKIKMQLMGERYEQIGEHVSTTQYLIGARILDISEGDRRTYTDFLRGRHRKSGQLTFGVDES